MRFKGLDLNLLIALHVLLEEQNVTRAAGRMYVGQTAMSAALSRLRRHFEDDLLIHAGRQMMPTALAEAMRRPLRDAIQHIEAVVDIDRRFVPGDSNRCFRVEMPEHLVPVLLPILTRLVFRDAPGISLDVRPSSGDPTPLLQRNELDLVVTLAIYSSPDFASEPLLSNALVLVGWSGNPALRTQPDLATVMALQQIIVRFDRARLASILTQEQLALYGGGERTALIAPNFSCIPSCLVGTTRFSLLFSGLAKLAAANLPIVIWDVPLAMPSMPEVMMFHPLRTQDAALAWLRAKLQDAALEADL